MKTLIFISMLLMLVSNAAFAQCDQTVYDCYPRQQVYTPPQPQYNVYNVPVQQQYVPPVQQMYELPVPQQYVPVVDYNSTYSNSQSYQQVNTVQCDYGVCRDHPVPKQGRNTTPAKPGYQFQYVTDCVVYDKKFYTWRINMCKQENPRWINPGWGNYLPEYCPQGLSQVYSDSTTREESYTSSFSQNQNWHHVAAR